MKKPITVVLFSGILLSASSAFAFTGELKNKNLLFKNEKIKAVPLSFSYPALINAPCSRKSKLFSRAEGGDAFGQGKVVISFGYGFPNLGKAVLTALISDSAVNVKPTGIGPLHFRAEYGLSDGVGLALSVNYISAGVKFTELPYEYTFSRSSLSVLGRLNFHFGTTESLDPYFGIGAGYKQATWSFKSNDPAYKGESIPGFSPFGFETTIGVRYYFTPGFGIYTELGIAKSVIQVGLAVAL